jgi:hypothetical protein
MSQRVAWHSGARVVLLFAGLAALLAACAKDPVRVDRNRPPNTFLVAAPAESASASYRIHLFWRGEDPDGYVAGFQWAWDDSSVTAFRFTTKTDSVFELVVNDSAVIAGGSSNQPPQTSKPHTFFIRAIDNLGKPDPSLTQFNHRIYLATTQKPNVQFVGQIPSGAEVDTLCDGQPFQICWTGSDPDGSVIGYRYNAGSFNSPIVQDTCATFNDPSNPNSISLASGLYTVTVQAVDNAFALSDPGASKALIVVNRDPETWFSDTSGARDTIGYYIQPFLRGQEITPVITPFFEGDTVPYRSTVFWNWNGQDNPCDNPNGIESYSLSLTGAGRNGNDPYTIGFIQELAPGVPFTTNDPAVVGPLGFTNLILDSLDAGNGMQMLVRARDRSGRVSGLPYSGSFTFNCNFPPEVTGFTVDSTCVLGVKSKTFRWTATDFEDGFPATAYLELDGGLLTEVVRLVNTPGNQPVFTVPESVFRGFSPENPHFADIYVEDRGKFTSANKLRVVFNVDYTTSSCP